MVGDGRNWYQQEFVFEFSSAPAASATTQKPKRKRVDYEAIYRAMCKGPLSFSQIEAMSGVSHCGVSQVITTLSLHYPVYEVSRGLYKVYGDEEYGDGINHAASVLHKEVY